MRVDLHTHTRYSQDATTRPSELVERAREAGLDRIAVTDHHSIEGALRAREREPDLVIIGEEIRCECGTELIGLFLRERIPDRLAMTEVAERIRAQGGVIYAPHPFAYPWRTVERAHRLLATADVIEVGNARAFMPGWNRAAHAAARRRRLPMGAGSDAHFPREIGRAYTKMPAFSDAVGFMGAAPRATAVVVHQSGAHMFLASGALKTWRIAVDRAAGLLETPEPRGTAALER